MSDALDNLDHAMGFAEAALQLIPNIPGTRVDTLAVGGAQLLIAGIRGALKKRTPEEVLAALRAMADEDAETIDVESIAESVLEELEG